MKTNRSLIVVGVVFMIACEGKRPEQCDKEHEDRRIASLIETIDVESSRNELLTIGESTLPALYQYAAGNQNDEWRLSRVFHLVANISGDRSQFVDLAGRSLTSPQFNSLWSLAGAVSLLRETKCSDYNSVLIRMISSEESRLTEKILSALDVLATSDDLTQLEARYRQLYNPAPNDRLQIELMNRTRSTIHSIQRRLHPEIDIREP